MIDWYYNVIYPLLPQEFWFVFLLFLSQASPGPDQAYVVRSSLAYGLRGGIVASAGIAAGLIFHAILVCTVGSFLFEGLVGDVFLTLAGGWMIYLGWKIWPKKIEGEEISLKGLAKAKKMRSIFTEALICNLLNAKCTLFLVSLCAPLLKDQPSIPYLFFVGFLIVITAFVGWSIWAYAFQWKWIRRFYANDAGWIDRFFAVALTIFGLSIWWNLVIAKV